MAAAAAETQTSWFPNFMLGLETEKQPAGVPAKAAPRNLRAPVKPEINGLAGELNRLNGMNSMNGMNGMIMSQREAVMHSLSGFSMEVTPGSADKLKGSFAEILPRGTNVNVTYLPGSETEETVRTCERLRREGMRPVPHVAARSLEGPEHLKSYLESLALRAEVEEVLVVGGGVSEPKGAYSESMQVLESGLLQRYGIKRVGLAAHPEGSPDIDRAGLVHTLRTKNQWAAEELAKGKENGGLEKVYLATQVCFDDAKLVAWAREICEGEAENRLPIRVGVAGPTTLKGMLKFAAMCGVEASARALRQHQATGNLLNMVVNPAAPDDLISALAKYVVRDPQNLNSPCPSPCRSTELDGAALIEGFHFFSSGGVAKTANWARKASEGNFTWDDELHQESFAVH